MSRLPVLTSGGNNLSHSFCDSNQYFTYHTHQERDIRLTQSISSISESSLGVVFGIVIAGVSAGYICCIELINAALALVPTDCGMPIVTWGMGGILFGGGDVDPTVFAARQGPWPELMYGGQCSFDPLLSLR